MFEKAARLRLRFPCDRANFSLTVEDLWDVSVEVLDSIFKKLNAQVKTEKEESLLGKKTEKEEEIELQIAIIRHVVEVKLKESAAYEDMINKKERKQELLKILKEKQGEEIKGKSTEEIQKMISELEL